jgi:flagellar hook-associated protein 1 FlgK
VSSFSGLNAATTSLWTQRRALDVAGQNIANVNTEGYSRQRADMQAIGGSMVPAFHSIGSGIGGGVNADDVNRIRDAFLEGRGHLEHANSARLTVESGALGLIEQSFREPGEAGIQSLLSEMWAGWEDVANNPQDLAARGQVLQRLGTVVRGVQSSQASLDAQWGQTRENLGVLVKDVNAAATSIAKLNHAIQQANQSDRPANELTDRRDVLIMQLAEQVGATVTPRDHGVVDVRVGGLTLVAGSSAMALKVAGTIDPADVDPDLVPPVDPPRIETELGGYPVRPGGTAGGQLNTLVSIIPRYREAMDDLAVDLAAKLNALHTTGAYDLAGTPGKPLLGPVPGPPSASTLELLISKPAELAASAVAPTSGVPSLDNGIADKIAQLRLEVDGVDDKYRQLIVELGVQAAVTERNVGIQAVITTEVDSARDSVAGVNLDEEMTNMLSFQHAYAAAGRMVTAIDQTLDILINRTGRVGL